MTTSEHFRAVVKLLWSYALSKLIAASLCVTGGAKAHIKENSLMHIRCNGFCQVLLLSELCFGIFAIELIKMLICLQARLQGGSLRFSAFSLLKTTASLKGRHILLPRAILYSRDLLFLEVCCKSCCILKKLMRCMV